MDPADFEARAAEFERANRRRRVIAFAILGVAATLAGIAAIAFALLYPNSPEYEAQFPGRQLSSEIKLVVGGVAAVIIGIGLAFNAYRIATRKIVDADFAE